MKKAARLILLLATLQSAIALSGPVIDGLEWYQPADLLGFSYNDFAAACNSGSGMCTGKLGATWPDLSGWIWAGAVEVSGLFNHFIAPARLGPGRSEYISGNLSPAYRFFEVFEPTVVINVPYPPGALGGTIGHYLGGAGSSQKALAGVGIPSLPPPCVPCTIFATNAFATDPSEVGAWLYRSVPAPSSLLLIIAGLLTLRMRRK